MNFFNFFLTFVARETQHSFHGVIGMSYSIVACWIRTDVTHFYITVWLLFYHRDFNRKSNP